MRIHLCIRSHDARRASGWTDLAFFVILTYSQSSRLYFWGVTVERRLGLICCSSVCVHDVNTETLEGRAGPADYLSLISRSGSLWFVILGCINKSDLTKDWVNGWIDGHTQSWKYRAQRFDKTKRMAYWKNYFFQLTCRQFIFLIINLGMFLRPLPETSCTRQTKSAGFLIWDLSRFSSEVSNKVPN